MAGEPVALMSVRPRFADALVDGSKTVEVRRRPARLSPGTLCLIYASSPVCALVGAMRVVSVDVGDPEAVWDRCGEGTALERWEYDTYLRGSPLACAIAISAVVTFAHAVPLRELRRRRQPFVAPQSYRFLGAGEMAALLNGQARDVELLAIAPTPHATPRGSVPVPDP